MLITVVIPTCDRPSEYLLQSIQSAMAQSMSPHEILVIDNGVRPVSVQALPHGVTLHRAKPLIGPSKARNIGARLSRGSHLAFLDDDDWWDKGFLEEAATVLRTKSCRCVYGKLVQYKNGELFEQINLTEQTAVIEVLLRTNPGASGQNLLIEKILFEEIGGFDENLKISEDRALAIEVLRTGAKIGIAPRAIAYARLHEGTQQKEKNSEKVAFVIKYRRLMPFSLFLRHLLKFGLWVYIRPKRWRKV